MTHIGINLRKFVGLSLWLVVLLGSQPVNAQPKPGELSDEGLASYIFSAPTVTIVLVLLLVAQLVYRNRTRRKPLAISATYNSPMMPDSPETDQASKKRYDKEELSKLLKASASTKNNGRSLEEAIRLSQMAQDDLLDTLDIRLDPNEGATTFVEPELQDSESNEQFLEEESQSFEVESHSVEAESRQEIETSK